MNNMPLIFAISIVFSMACNNNAQPGGYSGGLPLNIIDTSGKTIADRFNAPDGYKRISYHPGSFGYWLRELPLKKAGSNVMLYDGTEKNRQDVHAAVIDMEVGHTDLQQCADAVMRLRAEFLFSSRRFDKIHFNFTSGHRCDYVKWAEGDRPLIKGNKVTFSRTAAKDYSYANFRKYLQTVFTYAGSLSLSREMEFEQLKNITSGNVFIHGGLPGHAVIVLDVAVHEKTGRKIFLLGQSYMPAQEIHLLKNFENEKLSPWYEAIEEGMLSTPEWSFNKTELMRFE